MSHLLLRPWRVRRSRVLGIICTHLKSSQSSKSERLTKATAMARKRRQTEVKSSDASLTQAKATDIRENDEVERLSESTVKSAVEALLKDHTKYERKRLRRAQTLGKAGALLDAESFVMLLVTLKQAPFKDKLRPDAM